MTPMQSMRAAAIVAMVVPATAWAAQQQPVPQMAGVAQAAVTGCAQAHSLAERTIEAANLRLEAARQANSPAAMRAGIDSLQAALRQLRTDIAPCAGLQPVATADPHAGHVMPGTPVISPGSTGPASTAVAPTASDAADPHAGHVMPATPQPSANAPRIAPAQRPAAAAPGAAADPHAGHVMPAAAQAADAAPEATAALHAMTTVENPATRLADLMCQPQVDPDTAPRATYLGKAHYFCTAADRDLFLKAPAKSLQR